MPITKLILFIVLIGFVLPARAIHSTPSKDFTDNSDGTVTHKITGLIWKRCAEGQRWDGGSCIGSTAQYTYSEAKQLKSNFGGQNDWRLPTIAELNTIVEREVFSSSDPAVNTAIFPNTLKTTFWSVTEKLFISFYKKNYWTINFSTGIDGYDYDDTFVAYAVRLVRAGKGVDASGNSTPSKDFVDHGDGTVTHKLSNLMWQRCSVGQSWDGDTCTGSARGYGATDAQKFNNNFAGYQDWRLPTVTELNSLIEYNTPNPSINTTIFPNTPGQYFWTASTNLAKQYWGVHFGGGFHGVLDFILSIDTSASKPKIRLVRSVTTAPIVTNVAPVASFNATPTSGTKPLTVMLDASNSKDSDGSIINYAWISSDGQKSSGIFSQFIYSDVGAQLITLTVTDNQGASASTQKNITVMAPVNKTPKAAFTVTPESGSAPLQVSLDASLSIDTDGEIVSYTWKASNGLTVTGKTAQLIFNIPGNYTVTLGVTDNLGASASVSKTITVITPQVDLGYNATARLKPQVIMTGTSPSIIDSGDTEFEILALVRPGIFPLQNVTLGQGNSVFTIALKHINTLANGDQFWKTKFAFTRGAFGNADYPIKWGNGAGQFFIRATDTNQQSVDDIAFPILQITNAPAQVAAFDSQQSAELTYNTTRRGVPQIIMAGVSPAIIDLLDTSFDIVAIVRPGILPIKNVILQQGGNALFRFAMERKADLSNGDQLWVANFAFPQGNFGIQTMPIVWGTGANEFNIQVVDSAQQVSPGYPLLRAGNYPAYGVKAQKAINPLFIMKYQNLFTQ